MAKSSGFETQSLRQIAEYHEDAGDSLRGFFSPLTVRLNVRYLFSTEAELSTILGMRLAETELRSCLAILSSIEAALRIDYATRCSARLKDPLSRDFRDMSKRYENRASFDDILQLWSKHYPELKREIGDLRGAMMGASNPHPHCQIWATEHIPDEPLRELAAQQAYQEEHHSCMLCDYAATEIEQAQRIVVSNETFVAVVPYWATWPFETLVLPLRHLGSFTDLTPAERTGLAEILKAVTMRYDNLFQVSFPYTMGFHQRPTHGQAHDSMHFHAHFYPPLLRSAEIRKFMVGFEMLGMPQRDLTPETAAERLRNLPDKHHAESS